MKYVEKNAMWLREELKKGKRIIGSHIFAGSPMLTELMASMEFDIIWVDMEHAPFGAMDILNNVIAVRAGGSCSLVRISCNDAVLAKPILDMGPDVILIPNIKNLKEAKQAVEICKYPPQGVRGYGPQRAAMHGECSQMEYVMNRANEMLCAVQIEHIGAVEELEAIAQVEGIDLFIVGPNDLSASIGMLGQLEHPKMIELYNRISDVLTKAGKPFGVSCGYDPKVLDQWLKRGAQVLFAGYDSGYVRDGARQVVNGMLNLISRN